jgi:hypothetical protein
MTRLVNGRTPAQHVAWTRWHVVVAILLALSLLLLWLGGRGPGFPTTVDTCCSKPRAVAILPPAAMPAVPAAPAGRSDSDGDGTGEDVDRPSSTPP